MPINERHYKQKTKNYALLAILVAFIALMYSLTMLRLGE